jgi:hypothetical protein
VVLVHLLQEGVAALEGRERARHAALARVRVLIPCSCSSPALLLLALLAPLALPGRLRRRLEREDQLGERVQLCADLIVQVPVEEIDGDARSARRGCAFDFDSFWSRLASQPARRGAGTAERCHLRVVGGRDGLGGPGRKEARVVLGRTSEVVMVRPVRPR